MEMKKNELLRRYRASGSSARDKRAQIKILAELNGTTDEKIREALMEAGIKEEELPKKTGPKKVIQGDDKSSQAEKPQEDKKEDATDGQSVPEGMSADNKEKPEMAAVIQTAIKMAGIVQDNVREQIERKEEAFEKVTEAIVALRKAVELMEEQ